MAQISVVINARKRKTKPVVETDYRDLEARDFAQSRECHSLAPAFSRFYTRSEHETPESAWPEFVRKYDEMFNQAAIDARREWVEAQRLADYKKVVYQIICREIDQMKGDG